MSNKEDSVIHGRKKMNFIDLIFEENETKDAFVVEGCLSESKCIYIPDEVAGKPVIALSSSFRLNEYNKILVLGKHIESISNDIINEFKELTIYAYKDFKGSNNNKDITIRTDLMELYNDMDVIYGLFKDGTAIVMDNKLEDSIKMGLGKYGRLVVIPEVIKQDYRVVGIGDYCFEHSFNLRKILLPESLQCVGKYAFFGCSMLESIAFNSSIRDLGDYCLSNCNSLRSVEFNDIVGYIGKDILRDSQRSFMLFIQTEITTFNPEWNNENRPVYLGFIDFISKEELIFGIFKNNRAVLLNNEFRNFKSVVVPNMIAHENELYFVDEIGPYAFFESKYILSIDVPYSVKKINEYAFSGTNISELVLPENLEYIGNGLLANCLFIKQIKLPENLRVIPKNFATNCLSLETLITGNNIVSLGESCFEGCSKLTNFDLPDSIEIFEPMCLYGTDLPLIIVGNHVKEIGELAFQCNKALRSIVFKNIDVILSDHVIPEDNRVNIFYMAKEDNVLHLKLYESYGKKLQYYPGITDVVSYKGVIYILNEYDSAFIIGHQENNLQEDTIILDAIQNHKTIRIEQKAFYNSKKIRTLYIPNNVTALKSYFIENCSNLRKVSISGYFSHLLVSWYPGSINAEFEIRSHKVSNITNNIELS